VRGFAIRNVVAGEPQLCYFTQRGLMFMEGCVRRERRKQYYKLTKINRHVV